MIEALCQASAAGVPADLIVRGFGCLRPGVAGRTSGIRVRSIIGRFLEHSRIFHFAAGREEPTQGEFYIGPADWMYRNLSNRVEVVAPILSDEGKEKLWEVGCWKQMVHIRNCILATQRMARRPSAHTKR